MAYLALYRQWRPQNFDALVGQQDLQAQGSAEGLGIDAAAAAQELVDKGQHNRHRQARLLHLGDQPQPALEVRGVDDHQDARQLVGLVEHLGDDLLVGADGVEGVGAGEVLDDDGARERWDLSRRELYVAMTRARDGLWVGISN